MQGCMPSTLVRWCLAGPRQPENLQPYLQRTVDAFCAMALSSTDGGIAVTERYRDEQGNIKVNTIHHKPFLRVCLCDTPARNKLGGFRGVGAFIGACSFCCLEGSREEGARSTSYTAYSKPQYNSWQVLSVDSIRYSSPWQWLDSVCIPFPLLAPDC